MSSWECPFCGRLSVEAKIQQKYNYYVVDADTKQGKLIVQSWVHVCPNPDCKEFTYISQIGSAKVEAGQYVIAEPIESWVNRPQGVVKQFPDYIPKAILNDYKESAMIATLSPKASATLARRCLQGMIRDFWGVKEKNLFEEIKAIQGKVDSDTWHAIDAIRSIGNIGAHMEKDIDLIIDVDKEEAELLISLIETLLSDWYVERENRRLRSEKIVAAAAGKKVMKQQN
ncbi:DUF4145 domain-containing protein [Cronobacter sakazakii]|uniref:DUF4145 domain-containing protein n=1 Tax=Cronobacter sakazakii TaxID=28141 RepID=UPI000A18A90E|nr:DUF4145 domain-containing protein [Cronobacter sakazakii]ELY2814934.1 DUF4145 domain-containing protein [Cronobacter sakazakii]ELY4507409.1 DUF4145 domain-containing protein [Cronobacter sakazakii]PQY53925.1 DUF4145 domain-containing protein [Cronobacter sakazakii]PUZ03106.1 DUF4145 domain-containing protein [Cronobacter sakazakii]